MNEKSNAFTGFPVLVEGGGGKKKTLKKWWGTGRMGGFSGIMGTGGQKSQLQESRGPNEERGKGDKKKDSANGSSKGAKRVPKELTARTLERGRRGSKKNK